MYGYDETLDMLREIVAEYGPETRYSDRDEYYRGGLRSTCRYRDNDGNPLCIVGVLLHKIDPQLIPAEGRSVDGILPEGMFSVEAVELLVTVQDLQDSYDCCTNMSRWTWEEAVRRATDEG